MRNDHFTLQCLMCRSNCSASILQTLGNPEDITFFICPGLFITLFLPCLSLINNFNPSIFQCPALFYHTNFSSDPGAARGIDLNKLIVALLVTITVENSATTLDDLLIMHLPLMNTHHFNYFYFRIQLMNICKTIIRSVVNTFIFEMCIIVSILKVF